MPDKRMLLVFNPQAGTRTFPLNLYEVVRHFTGAGYLVTTYPTAGPGDARDIITRLGGGYDCVVCSGGDGTLNESVDALMAMAHPLALGYIPCGTTNDFATSLGLPKDILAAASVITDGELRPLDIGQFGEEYFSYVAAFGLFTDVSYATPQSRKNVLGHLAYLLEGVKRLGSIHTHHCTVDLGDEVLSGEYIFGMVTNSLSVGGFKLPLERNIKMDDGLFEVALLQMPTSFFDLQNVIASLINQEHYTDSLIVRKARHVVVTSEKPLAWTLDGEFGGELEQVAITNRHNAVKLMMPPEKK